jgi:1-deoxy-D-xylulose-5-phosphate synthase
MANGLSVRSKIPVICIHSSFLPRAYDQLIQDICLPNVHTVILLARSGFSGPDGPSHHGVFDLTYIRCIPNLTLISPKCGEEYYKFIENAINSIQGPVVILTPHANTQFSMELLRDSHNDYEPFDVVSEGSDVIWVTVGTCFSYVTRMWQNFGRSYGLLHIRIIKPFNEEKFKQIIKRYKKVIVFEENSVIGGIGSEISKLSAEDKTMPPVTIYGIRDSFIQHGDIDTLRDISGMKPEVL